MLSYTMWSLQGILQAGLSSLEGLGQGGQFWSSVDLSQLLKLLQMLTSIFPIQWYWNHWPAELSQVSKEILCSFSVDGDLNKPLCSIHPFRAFGLPLATEEQYNCCSFILYWSYFNAFPILGLMQIISSSSFFFFGKEIIVVWGSPKQGTKTSKSAIIIKGARKSFTLIMHS